jgi:hypothetical protein
MEGITFFSSPVVVSSPSGASAPPRLVPLFSLQIAEFGGTSIPASGQTVNGVEAIQSIDLTVHNFNQPRCETSCALTVGYDRNLTATPGVPEPATLSHFGLALQRSP